MGCATVDESACCPTEIRAARPAGNIIPITTAAANPGIGIGGGTANRIGNKNQVSLHRKFLTAVVTVSALGITGPIDRNTAGAGSTAGQAAGLAVHRSAIIAPCQSRAKGKFGLDGVIVIPAGGNRAAKAAISQ